jgi:hypothetical protein
VRAGRSVHTAEVTGSIPVAPTSTNIFPESFPTAACQKICQKTTHSVASSALSVARFVSLRVNSARMVGQLRRLSGHAAATKVGGMVVTCNADLEATVGLPSEPQDAARTASSAAPATAAVWPRRQRRTAGRPSGWPGWRVARRTGGRYRRILAGVEVLTNRAWDELCGLGDRGTPADKGGDTTGVQHCTQP